VGIERLLRNVFFFRLSADIQHRTLWWDAPAFGIGAIKRFEGKWGHEFFSIARRQRVRVFFIVGEEATDVVGPGAKPHADVDIAAVDRGAHGIAIWTP